MGFLLINPEDTTGQQAGSIYLMDTFLRNITTGIEARLPSNTTLDSSIITLDNIEAFETTNMVKSWYPRREPWTVSR